MRPSELLARNLRRRGYTAYDVKEPDLLDALRSDPLIDATVVDTTEEAGRQVMYGGPAPWTSFTILVVAPWQTVHAARAVANGAADRFVLSSWDVDFATQVVEQGLMLRRSTAARVN